MLHNLLRVCREGILQRVGAVLSSSQQVFSSHDDLQVFLTELTEVLNTSRRPVHASGIAGAAAKCGRDLHARGFTPADIVHRYGAVCDAITSIAAEHHLPITADEFGVLNRCIDLAIAAAVEAHSGAARLCAVDEETRRMGEAAHELRDLINTAMLALTHVTNDRTREDDRYVAMLGRSLVGLQYVVDNLVSGVRLTAAQHVRERVDLTALLEHLALIGALHAKYRSVEFRFERDAQPANIEGDSQLLASAVMNLLHNAFKNTHKNGHVLLRCRQDAARAVIDIEDECGGIPYDLPDPFSAFGDRRGLDRKGLGLGLAMARDAVRLHGGDITLRNLPGKGCIFTIEIPVVH
jgi:signal transduction histidine kinase